MTTEELRAIAEAATSGPWNDQAGSLYDHRGHLVVEQTVDEAGNLWPSPNDATFITAARNHWDAMLDVIEAAERLLPGYWDPDYASTSACQSAAIDLESALARLKEIER